jgi:hypothetical protein
LHSRNGHEERGPKRKSLLNPVPKLDDCSTRECRLPHDDSCNGFYDIGRSKVFFIFLVGFPLRSSFSDLCDSVTTPAKVSDLVVTPLNVYLCESICQILGDLIPYAATSR